MKNITIIIAALFISVFAQAEEVPAHPFIGAGTSQIESQDQSEDAQSFSVGLQFNQASQLEFVYSDIDSEYAESYDQKTLRLVSRLFSVGNHSMTMQAGYSHGEVDALGETFSDNYGTLGVGYQYQIGEHIAVRYMINKYFIGEFDNTGIDLKNPVETSLSAIYAF